MTEKTNASREAVKKTGKAFLIAGSVLGAIFFWKSGFEGNAWKWFLGSGIALFGASHFAYPIMKPVHIGWMKFAFVLGWINTRILLGVFFYLILTPIGLLMRLFGNDLLDEKIEPTATSYWKKRTTTFDPRTMERQF